MNFDWSDNHWVHDRNFWLWCFSPGVELPRSRTLSQDTDAIYEYEERSEIDTVVIPVAFPDDFGLTFSVSGGYHELKLSHPSHNIPVHLGHMDCQQISGAFRWTEYELITDWLATEQPPQYPPWATRT